VGLDPIEIIIRAVDKTQQALNAPIKSLKDLEKVATALKPAFNTVGTAVVAAFTAMEIKFLSTADALSKASEKTGIGAEALSQLEYAARQADVEVSAFENAITKLNKAIIAAKDGTGKEAEAFAALGVSISDSNGKLKTTQQVFEEVSQAMSGFEDGAGKAEVATRLFGKAGANIIPMLNQGAEGLKSAKERADEFNLTISSGTAAAAEAFNDNMETIKEIGTTGFMNAMNEKMLPALSEMSKNFVSLSSDILNTFKPAIIEIGNVIGATFVVATDAAMALWAAIKAIGDSIGVKLAAAALTLKGDFKGAFDTLKTGAKEIEGDIAETTEKIIQSWNAVGKAYSPANPNGPATNAKKTFQIIDDASKKATDAEKKRKEKEAADLKKIQEQNKSTFLGNLDTIASLSTSKNKTIAAAAKSIGIAQATVDTFVAANKALSYSPFPLSLAYATAAIAVGLANVAKISGVALATGGVVTGPTQALIGEAGPEAVIPLNEYSFGGTQQTVVNLEGKTILNFVADQIRNGRLDLKTGRVN